MPTYSLLQTTLGQTINLASLEEASLPVQSVARVDCIGIQKDLFGIVISNLSLEDAEIFQRELRRKGFPTDVVPDDELPVLHEAFTIQRVEILEDSLVFTNSMGRAQRRPKEDLVFVGGGFLTQLKIKSKLVISPSVGHSRRAEPDPVTREFHSESLPEFRMDFFFWSEPNRLRASVSAESTVFLHGRPLRLRETALLLGAMMDLRELLPDERIAEGLKRPDANSFYPSLRSYEEEIRWHFYRLKSGA